MRRLIAALAIVAALLPLGPGLHSASAAATTVYHNAKFGYTVTYPSDWKVFSAKGTDLAIETADTGAVFDGVTLGGATKPTAADLRDAVTSMLGSAGVPASVKVTYGSRLLHGATFTVGTGTQKRTNGQTVVFTGFVTYRAHVAYAYMTALVASISGVPRTAAPAQQRALDKIVASITVTGPAK